MSLFLSQYVLTSISNHVWHDQPTFHELHLLQFDVKALLDHVLYDLRSHESFVFLLEVVQLVHQE